MITANTGAKDRPILFSAPMVRALLDGSKTQTRRVAKLTDAAHVKEPRGHRRWHPADPDATKASPYGQPGDKLWVRETWAHGVHALAAKRDEDGPFVYAATDSVQHRLGNKWTPGIHMFRYASRITLKITGVRVERLQDISEVDALAEGVYDGTACKCAEPLDFVRSCGNCGGRLIDSIGLYRALWEHLNGPGSWDANPWVWVIEFHRMTA